MFAKVYSQAVKRFLSKKNFYSVHDIAIIN